MIFSFFEMLSNDVAASVYFNAKLYFGLSKFNLALRGFSRSESVCLMLSISMLFEKEARDEIT